MKSVPKRRAVFPKRKITEEDYQTYGPEYQPFLMRLLLQHYEDLKEADDVGTWQLWTYNLLDSVYKKGILDERRAAKTQS
jgi:hypothetical protein